LSDKFEEMKTKIIEVSNSNFDCKKTTSKLSKDKSKFEDTKNNEFFQMDQLEQYGRRLNLEFEVVPQYSNENVTDIVVQLTKKLNFAVRIDDISIAHRLPPKTVKNKNNVASPPTIIAQFTNKPVRNEIYANRRKAKLVTDFPIQGTKNYILMKILPSSAKKLIWPTKQTAQDKNFKFFLTKNGQTFVRKDETAYVIPIQSEHDLEKLE